MIFDFLFVMSMKLLAFIASFMPLVDSSDVAEISGSLNAFKQVINTADAFFPLDTFWFLFSLIMTIEATILTFHFFRWLVTVLSAGFVKAK